MGDEMSFSILMIVRNQRLASAHDIYERLREAGYWFVSFRAPRRLAQLSGRKLLREMVVYSAPGKAHFVYALTGTGRHWIEHRDAR